MGAAVAALLLLAVAAPASAANTTANSTTIASTSSCAFWSGEGRVHLRLVGRTHVLCLFPHPSPHRHARALSSPPRLLATHAGSCDYSGSYVNSLFTGLASVDIASLTAVDGFIRVTLGAAEAACNAHTTEAACKADTANRCTNTAEGDVPSCTSDLPGGASSYTTCTAANTTAYCTLVNNVPAVCAAASATACAKLTFCAVNGTSCSSNLTETNIYPALFNSAAKLNSTYAAKVLAQSAVCGATDDSATCLATGVISAPTNSTPISAPTIDTSNLTKPVTTTSRSGAGAAAASALAAAGALLALALF